jgi:hypothetical protein
VNNVLKDIIASKVEKGLEAQFFNPATATKSTVANAEAMIIKWRAFPKNEGVGWAAADIRTNQDEYCEWEVKRTSKEELESVTFTTEVPEVSYLCYLVG